METINLGALITFVIVTIFTPGPNNISSSAMGILYGYKSTLHYLLGIALGFFVIMLLSGVVSLTLYSLFPSLEAAIRLIGAGYILWLAYKTLKSTYNLSAEDSAVLGMVSGILLQLVNPKTWVFGLTLYTTFLVGITNDIPLLVISAVILATIAFLATSTWAISGAAIKRLLVVSWLKKGINVGLALLLTYTAIELSGIL